MTSKLVASVPRLRARLLAWYAQSHRDLPWRRTRDAYRIWVSEIMLQQTRVDTVLPYYERFLARFPDVRSLAQAELDDVLSLWSGLGYYRRARMLHAAAHDVVREHGGLFPRSLDEARELPGIGRSTAGAIVSISYGTPAPVLDGNVKRVLTRLRAWRGDPDARPHESKLWELAQQFVDCDSSGDVNQALMELGATICLPFAAAHCDACPVRELCAAHAAGSVAEIPTKSTKNDVLVQTWAVAIAERDGRRLVHQRDPTGLLHGMFEFPTCELSDAAARSDELARGTLAKFLRERFAVSARVGAEILKHRHGISNRRVTERAFAVELDGRTNARGRWLDAAAIDELAITTATRKILARLHAEATNAPLFASVAPRSPFKMLKTSAATSPPRVRRRQQAP